ncbi:MAG TPA: serine hydrolase, partial [Candidatus Hydrogenedentes bacterium]|nr:serine hydrolase [Candidatus Hydrogenedentota bacterium]
MATVRRHKWLLCTLTFLLYVSAAQTADDSLVYDIPKLEGVIVDGDPADWGGQGFQVNVLTHVNRATAPPDDFDARFRLAWDDSGLLFLLRVQDDEPVESKDMGWLWQKDSIEAFVAPKVGGPDYYQTAVAPGCDPETPELRHHFYDFRFTEPKEKLAIEAVRTRTNSGYLLEIRWPWTNFAAPPKQGDAIGFQLFVNDSDASRGRFQLQFYPLFYSHNSNRMHHVRLTTTASPDILAKVWPEYYGPVQIRLSVLACDELSGKTIEARDGGRVLATGTLSDDGKRPTAKLLLPLAPKGGHYENLALFAEGRQIAGIHLADADKDRAVQLVQADINFKPYVFTGGQFPKCDFEKPRVMEGLLGNYALKTTFYDKDYGEVTQPETPGRYGAVVEVIPERGRPFRRFRTLCRVPDTAQLSPWWTSDIGASITLPETYGIDSDVATAYREELGEYLKMVFSTSLSRTAQSGALFAGLYEAAPTDGPRTAADSTMSVDRQWWVGLKRKIYGTEAQFPEAFLCPRPIEGPPAPVIRKGSAKEAGMMPGAKKKLDALLRTWAGDTDEAFAVCIARNGVAFLHKAYGERDGKPMTLTTKSYMASITKLLSGVLMMTVVDQGLVGLDEPVDKYIPPLRGIEIKTPLTIRHLYNHTSGITGHWRDDMNDFEEALAASYPFISVGAEHLYTGAGYALAGKVIESVTGEAIPQFY